MRKEVISLAQKLCNCTKDCRYIENSEYACGIICRIGGFDKEYVKKFNQEAKKNNLSAELLNQYTLSIVKD